MKYFVGGVDIVQPGAVEQHCIFTLVLQRDRELWRSMMPLILYPVHLWTSINGIFGIASFLKASLRDRV